MHIVTLMLIGNSMALTIPARIAREMQLERGAQFIVAPTSKTSLRFSLLNTPNLRRAQRRLRKSKA